MACIHSRLLHSRFECIFLGLSAENLHWGHWFLATERLECGCKELLLCEVDCTHINTHVLYGRQVSHSQSNEAYLREKTERRLSHLHCLVRTFRLLKKKLQWTGVWPKQLLLVRQKRWSWSGTLHGLVLCSRKSQPIKHTKKSKWWKETG